jgi:hypothetical protein
MRRQDYGSNCPCCDNDNEKGRHRRARREGRAEVEQARAEASFDAPEERELRRVES